MKTLFIIPGFKHNINTEGYNSIISIAEEKGYDVRYIQISWNFRVMSDYISEVRTKISSGKDTYVLGFSFGAMIALKLSQEMTFKKVILCSLSPYFSEDVQKFTLRKIFNIGLRRWYDFYRHYSEKAISNPQNISYVFVYGECESDNLKDRNKTIIQKLGITEFYILKGVKHEINDSKYIKQISNLL